MIINLMPDNETRESARSRRNARGRCLSLVAGVLITIIALAPGAHAQRQVESETRGNVESEARQQVESETRQQTVPETRQQVEPEGSSGDTERALATTGRYMISTANAHASEAGREILREGGSAVDAAIAAQLVLGLVEPQSSGPGGGAFLIHWNRAAQDLKTYDGRETAPRTAQPDRFLKDGAPIPFDRAVHSGLSIGTPGVVRLLETTHRAHGKLPWARLFEPAIKLAEQGFEVSSRLHFLLRWFGPDGFAPAARRYFFDAGGAAWPTGHLLKNPEYAATLKAIAAGGAEAFYAGPIAAAVVAAAKDAPNVAGDLALGDLAAYQVKERAPLCVAYETRRVCGMGPPSSGGVAVAQIMALLDPLDLGHGPDGAMGAQAMHLIAEAEKLAYADRDRYLADPDFVAVPAAGLLDPAYLDRRRALIDPARAMPRPAAGAPPGLDKRAFGEDATLESVGTSHLSVIDADGNAVALTTTIEGAFGSGVWAAGFLLNNQLTDFSFRPADAAGTAIANRVEGGKRPRSTMAPTIVFDDKGEVFALLGSPGGSRIILYVVKALVALLDWDLDAQAAAALTNFGSMGGPAEIEYGWASLWHALKLKRYGHSISPDLMNSGLHIIVVRGDRLEGGADPRREGAPLGD
jgi:gamma-glutamyltranspeptidase/glutathione hydrolase